MVHDLAQRAHFEVPVGALDAHDLARLFGALDELAQILVRRAVGVEALRLAFVEHGGSFHLANCRFCHGLCYLSCPRSALTSRQGYKSISLPSGVVQSVPT